MPPLSPPESLSLSAEDGYPLGALLYSPPAGTPTRATLLVLGATAVRQRLYEPFARWLTGHGVRVVTFDYRGVGRSRRGSLRGFQATMSDWAFRDARAALRWLAQQDDAGPRFVLGHSFGGQLLGLLDELNTLDGVVLVGSQMGSWRDWPRRDWPWLALFFYGIIPVGTAVAGYLPGALGLRTDVPSGVVREWSRWCRHPGYLTGHFPDAAERFRRFTRPTLAFSFSDDDLAPRAAVEALLDRIPDTPLRHRRVRPAELGHPVGHFGFFRPDASPLWDETLAFLDALITRTLPPLHVARDRPRHDLGLRLEDVLGDLRAAPALS